MSRPAPSMRCKMPCVLLVAAACLTATLASSVPFASANAQEKPPAQQNLPDQYKLNMMIRTTLIALNHANRTGNYTVLRDLATPAFQQTNSAARLGEIFSKLRKRNIDLSPILFFQPKLVRPPQVNENGLMRLTGFFETKPQRITFDMFFRQLGTDWRLFGLSVNVASPNASGGQSSQGRRNGGGGAPRGEGQRQTRTQGSVTQGSVERDRAFVKKTVSMPTPAPKPAPRSAGRVEPSAGQAPAPSAETARSSGGAGDTAEPSWQATEPSPETGQQSGQAPEQSARTRQRPPRPRQEVGDSFWPSSSQSSGGSEDADGDDSFWPF